MQAVGIEAAGHREVIYSKESRLVDSLFVGSTHGTVVRGRATEAWLFPLPFPAQETRAQAPQGKERLSEGLWTNERYAVESSTEANKK